MWPFYGVVRVLTKWIERYANCVLYHDDPCKGAGSNQRQTKSSARNQTTLSHKLDLGNFYNYALSMGTKAQICVAQENLKKLTTQ